MPMEAPSPSAPLPTTATADNPEQTHLEANLASTRRAFRASSMYLAAVTLAFLAELYLALQSGIWQHFAIAGMGAVLMVVVALCVRLIRQGRPQIGIRWLIAASLMAVLGVPFLVAGFGLILGLGTVLVVLTIALQTLPQKEANWVLFVSVGVAIAAGGLDLLSPPTQETFPAFGNLILSLGGLLILIFGWLAIRQFNAYPLTTKLILAFLVVSLGPLSLLAFFNSQNTRQVLTRQAQQALLAAVSTTAADIDTFISDTLESIQTEAQLPALADYLRLAPEDQAGSLAEAAAIATLRELGRKDKVFIESYALLDLQGRNLIDTNSANVGQDEAQRDYFQKPLETGLPYLSPVEFDSLGDTPADPFDEAALYFSSPVRDPETQETLGVLRVRFRSNILQMLVVQNNGLVGEQSFAILFDENYVRLAHGLAPEFIFKSVAALDSAEISRLQAMHRLPNRPPAELAMDLPDLVAGLDNAIFEPSFTSRLETTGDKINLVVVKELETQPWLVVFAQPRDLFLSPIQAQTRTTLFFAVIIAGVVAAAAFGLGQFLAKPLVYLTEAVTRFTGGDLQARARPYVKSDDEAGVLAASFDTMAEQVGSLVRHLEERTHDLENQIVERERAEADLLVSERKYRTLFEESKDIIFITTPQGNIIDVNPAGVELSGYSRAELLQCRVQDLYAHEIDRRRFVQTIRQQGAINNFEVKLCTKDGRQIDCIITATVRQAEDGTVLGYQGIIRDVTGQKQVERERLRLSAIERELTLAQEIQHRLLPLDRPTWIDLEVVCYSLPAREMGGDFYAYHAFQEPGIQSQDLEEPESPSLERQSPISNPQSPKYALAVGDVSGKGMPAALLMAVSVASFQAIIGQALPPRALLAHLDQAISPYTRTTRQNCALVYAEIIPPNGTTTGLLRVANAGCVMPIIHRAKGSVEWVEAYGTPLGVALGAEIGYVVIDIALNAGDVVILVSDGVIEATNQAGELFSFDQLEAAIAAGPTNSAQAMLAHLRHTLTAFVGQTEPHDDLTIVVAKV